VLQTVIFSLQVCLTSNFLLLSNYAQKLQKSEFEKVFM